MTANEQTTEQARPAFKDTPEQPSLLDKIVSESRTERRDELILKREELNYKQRLAKMFANAQCFADVDKDEKGVYFEESVSIARAMIKIELGESMGFTAAESMTGIDIIKGRPAIGASLRAARMKKAGYSWPAMVCNDKGCWMPLEYQGKPMMHQKVDADGKPTGELTQVVVTFLESDAKMSGLLDKAGSMYKKDPSAMYFARTVTRAQRRYGPEVLSADILDTYEARDISEPSSPMATATEAKTDALAEKLAAARKEPKREEVKQESAKPEVHAPDPWAERVLTFKAKLGEPEFLAVLHATIGSEDVSKVTADNYKPVWTAMEAACKKAGDAVPVGAPPKGALF